MSNFVSAGAQILEGRSAQRQAEANAAIDRQNAAVVHEETKARTLNIFRQGESASKSIRATTASRGLLQEGSPLLLQAEAVREAEMASLEEQRIGLTEERRLLQSAALNVRRGKAARSISFLNAGASIIKGVQSTFG